MRDDAQDWKSLVSADSYDSIIAAYGMTHMARSMLCDPRCID
jgi:hypothetical protein